MPATVLSVQQIIEIVLIYAADGIWQSFIEPADSQI